jgi:ketosteroid isomerase-like protein
LENTMPLGEHQSVDESIALVHRYISALNTGDIAKLDELFADDFVNCSSTGWWPARLPSGGTRRTGGLFGVKLSRSLS